MKSYEYKFVEVAVANGLKVKPGETFERCKEVIVSEAKNDWRFKQVVMPLNEKTGIYSSKGYQIIFEKEVE